MRYLLLINCLALTFLSLTVFAQTSPQAQSVIESRAGSATQTTVMTASALVVGIEKATRTLMLELSSGEVVEVVADDRVRNFDQISLGDELVVEYMQSISLNLQKVRSDDRDISVGAAAARAEPGERPAGAAGQVIQALADVVAVSPEKSTITLRGPLGRVVELKVQNQDHFKVVRVGDQVLVTYTEAVAVSVEPAKSQAPSN